MTDWQKIAKIYKSIEKESDISGQAFELAIGLKLADMCREDAEVIAAVTGEAKELSQGYNYQLDMLKQGNNYYFAVFPDIETAQAMGRGYIKCKVKEILSLMYRTPQMHGILLVVDYNESEKNFVTGEITKNMAYIALAKKNP